MRRYLSMLSLAVMLLLLSLPVVESATVITDSVSEAGERLHIAPAVLKTTDAAKSAWLKNDIDSARVLYEQAVDSDSTYAPARYSLAKMLLYSRADSALLHARKAFESDSTNYWYLELYAQSLVGTDHYDEAVKRYRELIKVKPRDLNSYRILAIILSRTGRMTEAISLLDTAEMRVGRNQFLMSLKRQFLLSTSQVDRAISETRDMVNEMPYSVENRLAMAEVYVMTKNDSMAMAEYGEAMQLDSTRVETLFAYADYLSKSGRETEYLDVMRLVLQNPEVGANDKLMLLNELVANESLYKREYLKVGDLIRILLIQSPKERSLVELQVKHLVSMGMVEEAAKYLKGHLDDTPPQLSYYNIVVGMERHLNRPDSADKYLLRAIEAFPEQSSLRFDRAYSLVAQKRYDEAIECFEAEADRSADSLKSSINGTIGDIYYQKALASSSGGDEKVARKMLKKSYKSYETALKYDSNNALVLNNYAYFLCENDDELDRAHDMSKRSNEIEKSNPTYLDTYAWILYKMGDFDEAKVIMRQAISFDRTKNGEIALHYGEILYVLGETTMANFYWDKAISWGIDKELVTKSRERAEQVKSTNNK